MLTISTILTMPGVVSDLNQPLLWFSTLSFAAPLILAATGGAISERAGVVNIGLEGLMLTGAFFAVLTLDQLFISMHANPAMASLGGALGGTLAGALLAAAFAYATVSLRANQIIAGMAVNIFALGLTSFLFASVFGFSGTPGNLPGIPNAHIPGLSVGSLHTDSLSSIKLFSLGYVLFQQNPIFYVAIAAAVAGHWMLFRTRWGLRLRACGESPSAADAAGIAVQPVRYSAVILSGALTGLAGAYLVLDGTPALFTDNMTLGRGFIALAAVVIGRWTPLGALGACLVFGFGQALSATMAEPVIGGVQITGYLLDMIPYLVALVLAIGLVRATHAPAAAGVPFDPANPG